MKKIHFILCLVLINSSFAISGRSPADEHWNTGEIVLNNNQIIRGKVFYNLEHDLVQIKIDDRIKTYSPFNVHYFRYYDDARGIIRFYATFQDIIKKHKKHERNGPAFFEVLLGNDMVLMRKEENRVHYDPEILFNKIDLVPSMASRHYVLINDRLITFNNFHKDILPLMSDHAEGIENFIQHHKINPYDFVNQIVIIDYYNFLKNPSYQVLESQLLVKE